MEQNQVNSQEYNTEKFLQGANFSGETTPSASAPEDKLGLYYIKRVFEAIESKPTEAAILTSVIGYIIIAAFGGMDTNGKFFGYIMFLIGSFSSYFLIKKIKNQEESQKIKTREKFYISLVIILLSFILIEHSDSLIRIGGNLLKHFSFNIIN